MWTSKIKLASPFPDVLSISVPSTTRREATNYASSRASATMSGQYTLAALVLLEETSYCVLYYNSYFDNSKD